MGLAGILLIDKPQGPTSHDVVARIRQTSRESSIGHTGTLDPQATGLLPLVLGSATRLASMLSGGDKTYEASIRLGVTTDTDDAAGVPISEPVRSLPADAEIEAVLAQFRGTFEQAPPNHSAKHIGGHRAYALARRAEPMELRPVQVTVRELTWMGRDDALVRVRVVASAGFYVRALARDVGHQLGCGAHLAALRRTHSGAFDVSQAVPLEEAERLGRSIEARLLSPAEALSNLPSVHVTDLGLKRTVHGNPIGPQHVEERWVPPTTAGLRIRILGSDGRLVALAESRGGALHPVVVLG
jgi:tRNA pseudouridine55 synthase